MKFFPLCEAAILSFDLWSITRGMCDGFLILNMLNMLHPGRLTWNLKITYLKRKIIFQTSIIMFHVNLRGCNVPPYLSKAFGICFSPTWARGVWSKLKHIFQWDVFHPKHTPPHYAVNSHISQGFWRWDSADVATSPAEMADTYHWIHWCSLDKRIQLVRVLYCLYVCFWFCMMHWYIYICVCVFCVSIKYLYFTYIYINNMFVFYI